MNKEKIQQKIEKLVDNKSVFGVQLNIMSGDKSVIFEGVSGNFDSESKYFIASTTKIYTTAIIMKLIYEKYFDLDTKIVDIFNQEDIDHIAMKNGVDYTNQISVRNLLAHTSGLPDYFSDSISKQNSLENNLKRNIDEEWNLEKVIEFARNAELKFLPNSKNHAYYSDTNYQILGGIIEICRKKRLNLVFEEEIFEKLNLKNTYLYKGTSDQDLRPLYFKSLSLSVPKAMSSFGPDGGIVSNAYESNLFLHAFINGEFFPTSYWDQMKSEYNSIFFPLKYGVGFMKFQLPRIMTLFRKYPPLIGHSGLSGAFSFYSPDLDLYFSGTVNQINNPGRSYRLLIGLLNFV